MTCLTVAGLAFAVVPAQAAPGDAIAEGSAGAVTIGAVTVEPIAECSTEGTPSREARDVVVPNVVTLSTGRSTCTVDALGEIAKTTVTGQMFRFDALRRYGGPRIRIASYVSRCQTSLSGSSSTIQFSGLTGVATPSHLPANHVVTIPGGPNGRPMATVTFNEVVTPSTPDGSITVNLMHIRMFPRGGPTTGDAYVGTVHCAPLY
ncbi:MAG: hypothetical protein WBA97_33620 [Actinophytocola sp.]|uniref:hypothetical protein n=1 Tax=Actinophytocola sp. TaxID=1872138 RepID=UPI003C707916